MCHPCRRSCSCTRAYGRLHALYHVCTYISAYAYLCAFMLAYRAEQRKHAYEDAGMLAGLHAHHGYRILAHGTITYISSPSCVRYVAPYKLYTHYTHRTRSDTAEHAVSASCPLHVHSNAMRPRLHTVHACCRAYLNAFTYDTSIRLSTHAFDTNNPTHEPMLECTPTFACEDIKKHLHFHTQRYSGGQSYMHRCLGRFLPPNNLEHTS